jgi:hypothetical protein
VQAQFSSSSNDAREQSISPRTSLCSLSVSFPINGEKRRAKARGQLHKSQSLNALASPFFSPSDICDGKEYLHAVRRSSSSCQPKSPKSRYFSSPVIQTQSNRKSRQAASNGVIAAANSYDPFVTSNPALTAQGAITHQVQPNPYSQDTTSMSSAAFYQGQSTFQQPVSHPLGLLPFSKF